MPQLNRDELTTIIRDTLYATIGVGVLTVQQLDQARRQLAERLSTHFDVSKHQVDQLVAAVEDQMTNLDARLKVLERQLDGLLDSVQQRLPEQAGDALAKARKAGAEARKAATEAGEKLTSFVRDSAA
jgi:ABC-type transporter Mla subunit MlaD